MKRIIIGILFNLCCTVLFAQQAPQPGWLHKDLKQDTVFGISTAKAYEFLKGKKSTPVVVAVIDCGIDTAHEDLKSVLWINTKERRGNKKDDDHNHYADDINGWSFLGSAKGNVQYDNLELTRQVRLGKKRFGDLTSLPADTNGLAQYKRLLAKYNFQLNNARRALANMEDVKHIVDTILMRVGKKEPTVADIIAYEPRTLPETQIKRLILVSLQAGNNIEAFRKDLVDDQYGHMAKQVNYALNLSFDPRELVGDDYANVNERDYGTPDVTGPDAMHGTHVAGIIGAVRGKIGRAHV